MVQKIRRTKRCKKNIKTLYEEWEKVNKFYNYYTRMVSDTKYKSIHGPGLKILTPKQML